jgi:uncharacterized membrane protein
MRGAVGRMIAVLALCAALLEPRSAAALAVGETIAGNLAIGEKQVPLPQGDWIIAGLGAQDFDMPEVGAFGAIRSVILLRREGERIVAVAEINTNAIAVNDGWGRTRACERAQQFLLVTRYRTGWEMSCFFVQPTYAPASASGPETWQQARGLAAASRLALPDLWLTAGFRISDRQDIVDARFHFDPALFMGAAADAARRPADWATETVRNDPVKLGAAQLLATWAIGFDSWIERGLRNELGSASPVMPQVAAFLTDTPQVDAKLLALEQLYREGLLSRADYRAQSRQAATEVPMVVEPTGGLPLSVRKNISFRVFGSIVDYILAFAVTLSSPVSTGITATIVALHSIVFVFNDNFWEDYFARRTTRNAERIVDFSYIGQVG